MSHLTSESLARLVDETATTEEHAHLIACARCRLALDELRAQTAALRALPMIAPRSDAWERIAARVEEDRLAPPRRRWTAAIAVRAAAAVVLFALGTATGVALSRRSEAAPAVSADRRDAGAATPATVAVATPAPTREAAFARLRIAEVMYTSALLDYAALTSPQPPKDVVARLATLETIVLTTSTALERAPADPLINSYHLAALAERQTLLGQLRRTLETERWY
jgi:hypothetical protein